MGCLAFLKFFKLISLKLAFLPWPYEGEVLGAPSGAYVVHSDETRVVGAFALEVLELFSRSFYFQALVYD